MRTALALVLVALFASPVAAVTITEFPITTAASSPRAITAGPDGNLWFTEFFGNRIGRITPAGSVTEFAVANGGPLGITAGPDGNLWLTEASGNKNGRITPARDSTEFAMRTAVSVRG